MGVGYWFRLSGVRGARCLRLGWTMLVMGKMGWAEVGVLLRGGGSNCPGFRWGATIVLLNYGGNLLKMRMRSKLLDFRPWKSDNTHAPDPVDEETKENMPSANALS